MARDGIEFMGKIKKQGRVVLAGVALLALAACDPVPVGDTSCPSPAVCEIVALTASDVRSDIGKNYGGGVVLRNARALGPALVIDVSLPLSAEAFKTPVGQRIIRDFGKNLAGGFCSAGATSDDFFKMGATLRARGFSKDSVIVADQVIRSCGGRRR